jgi:hypothetical protein
MSYTPSVDVVVPLHSRRLKRALAAQKLNHAVPTIGLIASGAQALQHGARGFELALAIVEIVTSAFLIGSLVRSIRAARAATMADQQHHPHGIDWVDIWAAGVLFAEAGERWHLHHHVARPIILNGLLTLALGFAHGRMTAFRQRRRSMRLTADGIDVPGKPFVSFRARWKDIAAVTVSNASAEIRTRHGRIRRVDLSDLENAAEVRVALQEAQRRVAALMPKPAEEPADRI